MIHACISHDPSAPDRDWRDEFATDPAPDHHVNNHSDDRADPDRDDEEE